MPKLMREAIDALQHLPEDRQEMFARAILDYAAYVDGDVYHLSEEERRLIDEGLAQANRGDFVSEDEMEKFWNRHDV
jgi:predicted transcriptional regulator